MISFLIRHLLESTFFCLLLSGLACCLRKGATARHAVLLMGAAKFAIPTVLLAHTGEEIAFFWPAGVWLSWVTYKISLTLATIQNLFSAGREVELLTAWACGTVMMAVIWLVRWWRSKPVLTLPTKREREALARARAILWAPGDVRLCCSQESIEPAVRGTWRPTITIPKGLSGQLTPAEFEGVLLHELAHVRRFDNLTAVFVHAVVCLFWFHPLLWRVERRLTVERERACDETVIACDVKPQVYAAGILKVCQFRIFDTIPGVSAVTGADLKRRLELILDKQAPVSLMYVPWLLMAGLTVFMTLVPVAGGYCAQCAQTAAVSGVHCPTPATCAEGLRKGIQ